MIWLSKEEERSIFYGNGCIEDKICKEGSNYIEWEGGFIFWKN